MRLPLSVRPVIAATLVALAAGACTPVRSHQGYIVDADLVNSVQPGVDNRQSVLATLGRPSFTSQFAKDANGGDWYYVARDSRNLAFRNPRAKAQITLQISFDPAGNVTAIRRSGTEQIASVEPSSKTTPTLGKKRGFFEDLFGNIGTVGAPMGGSGGAGGGGGGGRTTP
ncbi:outer membrane protein assembly factor BamE [Sphingomonas aerophila]|uniref:Outer membrane protein assembly factor BamE (Lipoprotein component of BamABCDE complex) n=1 Tax=Sphingomonas aerophila TaxID=1344948 RepID=A0A7W9BA51_9SPHN|nr:outer membrane protein assembly factor BamE [Sphingomonas aerophila]MBB5713454.1 outer membrane protein assembly factor BamE (lipoprotein component of BamABCDE complex) [Sphingomonas aerophila]